MRLRRDCAPGIKGCIMRELLTPNDSPEPVDEASRGSDAKAVVPDSGLE